MLKAVHGSARVLLHRREVGELTFAAGGCTFRYTDDLLDPEHQVLGQEFEEAPRKLYRESVGLPAWFANLLPEPGSGLRRFYAALFDERQVDDARLLLTLGDDLPGAATVVPSDVPAEGFLVQPAIARVEQTGVHLSALAGAQPKMSVQRDGKRLTLPGRGEAGGWIVKFSSGSFPSLTENEYLMMRWAAEAGLDVPEIDLLPAESVPHVFDELQPGSLAYVVKRFDRGAEGQRVHIEDLAQATGIIPALRFHGATYDNIGVLVRALTGDSGFAEYLRRLVAMVVMGNTDAHLKNWSLRYPDGRTPTLAPAYDLVCTTFYRTLSRQLVFPIGGRHRPDAADLDAFEQVAEAAGYPDGEASAVVLETAERLRDAWREVRREPLLPELIAHIDERLERHPLTRLGRHRAG
ncbi:MAG: HipA domain-containing protein [Pseudonocardia sp.]|nr:HipA domain-containing protein [Pseudonocardia sp.]